jgi:D-arabinose 5-phosphate isomerase GutQ/GTP-binding protein EngB required for normal cell division
MRVVKKISTPFTQSNATHAIIIINAVDPQTNTIKAFIQACENRRIRYTAVINKIDKIPEGEREAKIKEIEGKLNNYGIDSISAKEGIRFDTLHGRVKAWKGGKIIILGVFNSGKTSIINALCGTSYKVGDIPGTTLQFTETMYDDNTTIIDSVGQLIDISKPMMISIDFSGCVSRDEKISMVFDEEIRGITQTKEGVLDGINIVIDVLKKQLSKGNKIIVSGAGASALVAKEIAGQGTECGLPVMVFTNDGAEIQPITFSKGLGEEEISISRYIANTVNKDDVVIAVSASGGTGFTYDLLRRAREKEAITIAITENSDTPLGKYADYILKSDAKPEGPSSSKIQSAHLVIGHAMMLVLADELGISADDSVQYMMPEIVENKKMGIK